MRWIDVEVIKKITTETLRLNWNWMNWRQ